MQRRDFLKSGAGLIAAGLSGPAAAQERINPRVLELIRFHWCYRQPKLRQNIYSLYNSDPNHPIIQAYRHAITVMKGKPSTDPTSWLYQANIHGTLQQCPARRCPVVDVQPRLPLPSWHRMYLYFSERIVQAASGDQLCPAVLGLCAGRLG
jgi:hypothetical protein